MQMSFGGALRENRIHRMARSILQYLLNHQAAGQPQTRELHIRCVYMCHLSFLLPSTSHVPSITGHACRFSNTTDGRCSCIYPRLIAGGHLKRSLHAMADVRMHPEECMPFMMS
jgi:hypothetical protein